MDQQKPETAEQKKLRHEIRERVAGFIAGALSLVAGLAWNDAIKSIIEYVFPSPGNTLPAKIMYAAVISLVVIVITVNLVRWANPAGDKK